MIESSIERWDKTLAWRKSSALKSWPPPKRVQRVYLAIRRMLARQDQAERIIDELTTSYACEDAISSLEDKGGMDWLTAQLQMRECNVRPSGEFLERWFDINDKTDREVPMDPRERILNEKAAQGDPVAVALLEMYGYEDHKDMIVAFANMCDLLKVNPQSESASLVFRVWSWKQMASAVILEADKFTQHSR